MFEGFTDVLTSGASAITLGENLEFFNPYPAIMWVLVFVVISQTFFVFALLKINEKNAKANELNRSNLEDLERRFERIINKFDLHDKETSKIHSKIEIYETLYNKETFEKGDG